MRTAAFARGSASGGFALPNRWGAVVGAFKTVRRLLRAPPDERGASSQPPPAGASSPRKQAEGTMRDDDTAPSRRETLQLMAAGALTSAGAASMSEARAQGGPQI